MLFFIPAKIAELQTFASLCEPKPRSCSDCFSRLPHLFVPQSPTVPVFLLLPTFHHEKCKENGRSRKQLNQRRDKDQGETLHQA